MGLPKKREDVLTTTSEKSGVHGFAEVLLRRFRTLSFLFLLAPVVVLCGFCIGLSLAPGIWLFQSAQNLTLHWPFLFKFVALGCSLSLAFYMYGLTLIFVVPAVNFLMPFRVRPFRGPWYSLPAVPWYVHNALTYIVRFTFLEFITPTPLNILFYRMMGMRIGKGVVINTTNISDPCMITLEDYVTIGGSATLFGHYGQKGYLIIAPIKVGQGTNVGLKASIMGGAQIGRDVTIKPHSCVLPKSAIGDGEVV